VGAMASHGYIYAAAADQLAAVEEEKALGEMEVKQQISDMRYQSQ